MPGAVFWDGENIGFGKHVVETLRNLRERIQHEYGRMKLDRIRVYGKYSTYSAAVRAVLADQCEMVYPSTKKKEAADIRLVNDIWKFCYEHRLSSEVIHVIIVSNDQDYLRTVSDLRQNGIIVTVLSTQTVPHVKAAASATFSLHDWTAPLPKATCADEFDALIRACEMMDDT